MDATLKEILRKQLQLLQEACENDMLPEEAAELSETLAEAVRKAARICRLLPLIR